MSEKIGSIFLVFALVLLLSACGKQNIVENDEQAVKQNNEVEQKQAAEQKQEDNNFIGKLKDAMGLGKSMKCTYRQDENNFGETYVKGNNVYAEFTAQGNQGYMISKDNCIYTWTDEGNKGVKMCSQPSEAEGETEAEEVDMSLMKGSLPEGVDYECELKMFADDKFNPPANIEFMDLDGLFGQ